MIIFILWLMIVILYLIFNYGANKKSEYKTEERVDFNIAALDLERSGIDVTVFDEIRKAEEEDSEFYTAVMKFDYENMIEEFWDSFQTKLNIMDMLQINPYDLQEGLNKHKKKLLSRGYIFKE